MALRTGLQRLHKVLLTTGILIAIAGLIGAVTSQGSDAWFFAGLGLLPVTLYLTVAWIAAGFLKKSDELTAPNAVTATPGAGQLPARSQEGAASTTESTELRADATDDAKKLYSAGVLKNRHMGYWAPDTQDATACPILASRWSRLWARWTDVVLETAAVAFVVGHWFPSIPALPAFSGRAGEQLLALTLLPLVMFLDAVLVAVAGNSFGKAIAGIQVKTVRGERPTFALLLKRNFGVWAWGLAIGVPLLNLVTMAINSSKLQRLQLTKWDEDNDTRCLSIANSAGRTTVTALVWFASIVSLSVYVAYQNDPDALVRLSVESINAASPQEIDEETRLDGARIGDQGQLVYMHTLVSVTGETHDLDAVREMIAGELGSDIAQRTCVDAGVNGLLNAGASILLEYSSADGDYLGSVAVNPSSCR